METIERGIEVDVPIRTAYNQWTQFEDFPNFMEGVEKVEQLDDKRLHWVAKIGGQQREWYARITEQKPDDRIAWASEDGAQNSGCVTFHRLDDSHCKVMLQLDFEPEGIVEKVGDLMGLVEHRVKGDLDKFKHFIEDNNRETGAWRGEIKNQ